MAIFKNAQYVVRMQLTTNGKLCSERNKSTTLIIAFTLVWYQIMVQHDIWRIETDWLGGWSMTIDHSTTLNRFHFDILYNNLSVCTWCVCVCIYSFGIGILWPVHEAYIEAIYTTYLIKLKDRLVCGSVHTVGMVNAIRGWFPVRISFGARK